MARTELRRPWFSALGAFLMLFACGLTSSGLTLFYIPVAGDLGFKQAQITLYASIIAIVGIGSYPLVGKLINRYGRYIRLIVLAGGIGLALGFICWSRCYSLAGFYAVSVAMGFFAAAFAPVAATSVICDWFIRRRALVIAIVYTGTSLGSIFFTQVGTALIGAFGWRSAYLILGFIGLIIIGIASRLISPRPELLGLRPYGWDAAEELPDPDTGWHMSLRQAIRTPALWLLSFGVLFGCTYAMGVLHTIIPSMQKDMGFTLAMATTVFTVYNFAGVAGKLLLGVLIDRFGIKAGLIYVPAFLIPAFLIVYFAAHLPAAMAFAVLFGLGNMFSTIITANSTAYIFGRRYYASIFGIVAIFYGAGFAIGPVLSGRVFDIFGAYRPFWLISLALAVISIVLVAVSCLMHKGLVRKYPAEIEVISYGKGH